MNDSRGVVLDVRTQGVLPVAQFLQRRGVLVAVLAKEDDKARRAAEQVLVGVPVVRSVQEAEERLNQLTKDRITELSFFDSKKVPTAAVLITLLRNGKILPEGDYSSLLEAGLKEATFQKELERYYQ